MQKLEIYPENLQILFIYIFKFKKCKYNIVKKLSKVSKLSGHSWTNSLNIRLTHHHVNL